MVSGAVSVRVSLCPFVPFATLWSHFKGTRDLVSLSLSLCPVPLKDLYIYILTWGYAPRRLERDKGTKIISHTQVSNAA
jgi:hypothetical protein